MNPYTTNITTAADIPKNESTSDFEAFLSSIIFQINDRVIIWSNRVINLTLSSLLNNRELILIIKATAGG